MDAGLGSRVEGGGRQNWTNIPDLSFYWQGRGEGLVPTIMNSEDEEEEEEEEGGVKMLLLW